MALQVSSKKLFPAARPRRSTISLDSSASLSSCPEGEHCCRVHDRSPRGGSCSEAFETTAQEAEEGTARGEETITLLGTQQDSDSHTAQTQSHLLAHSISIDHAAAHRLCFAESKCSRFGYVTEQCCDIPPLEECDSEHSAHSISTDYGCQESCRCPTSQSSSPRAVADSYDWFGEPQADGTFSWLSASRPALSEQSRLGSRDWTNDVYANVRPATSADSWSAPDLHGPVCTDKFSARLSSSSYMEPLKANGRTEFYDIFDSSEDDGYTEQSLWCYDALSGYSGHEAIVLANESCHDLKENVPDLTSSVVATPSRQFCCLACPQLVALPNLPVYPDSRAIDRWSSLVSAMRAYASQNDLEKAHGHDLASPPVDQVFATVWWSHIAEAMMEVYTPYLAVHCTSSPLHARLQMHYKGVLNWMFIVRAYVIHIWHAEQLATLAQKLQETLSSIPAGDSVIAV